jgi:hypothetical protein
MAAASKAHEGCLGRAPLAFGLGCVSRVSRVSIKTLGRRRRLAARKRVRGAWRRDSSGVLGGGTALEGVKPKGASSSPPVNNGWVSQGRSSG